MCAWTEQAVPAIADALARLGDPDDARAMAAYMRDRFVFLGVRAPARTAAWRSVRAAADAAHGKPDGDELVRFAEALWERPERELRYVAATALAAGARRLGPEHLPAVQRLVVTDAWWDTVDVLAPSVVGPLARAHPDEVVPVLDGWVQHDDHWLVRSAVLHQLKAKDATDVQRLAHHCALAAPHPEFFVRKAIGWALRQYSHIDHAWVEAFVGATDLSPLSEREALKAIRRGRG